MLTELKLYFTSMDERNERIEIHPRVELMRGFETL